MPLLSSLRIIMLKDMKRASIFRAIGSLKSSRYLWTVLSMSHKLGEDNVTVTATFDVISAVGINVLTGLIGAMVDAGL
jgi:hypothetical protein